MKYIIFIFLLLPFFIKAQLPHISASPGEYTTLLQRHDSAFDGTQGKPVFIVKNVARIFSGAHHYFVLYTTGIMAGAGDNSSGCLGLGNTTGQTTPQSVTVDNNGATLPTITEMALSANIFSPYWYTAALASNGTVYVCGDTQGGTLGDGTAGSATTTRFTKVPFPTGTVITSIKAGRCMMALDTAGNVWTWGAYGDQYVLGRGASPSYLAPAKISISGERATIIAGGSNWNYVYTTANHMWSWCYQYLTDYNGTSPIGTNPTSPENITSKLALPHNVWKMDVNNESSYALLTDSTLWSWGGNANGTIGNGFEIEYWRYGGYPVPYGGVTPPTPPATKLYWNWDQGFHELQVVSPIQIAPGKHNFTDIFVTNALCYDYYAADANNHLFAGGRNKQSICYGITAANPNNGNMQSMYPNSWDCPYMKEIFPFKVTTVWQSPSPDCLKPTGQQLHPDVCAIYTIPAHTPPTAVYTSQAIGNTIVLNAAASTDTRFISYYIHQQTGGTAIPMGVQDTPIDTITNVPNGTYTFRIKLVNDNWDSTFATTTVTVPGGAPPSYDYYIRVKYKKVKFM